MKQFGLIGRQLTHSYSPQLHRLLGEYAYDLYPLEPHQLPAFMGETKLDGFNVTIPYKQAVIPFCSRLTPAAAVLENVNTVIRQPDGSFLGDNTDAQGFRCMLERGGIDTAGKKALVLGTGGAAHTAAYVLRQLGAQEVTMLSRCGKPRYEQLERYADAQLIVNATPVGMFPETEAAPIDLQLFPRCEAVADVIYNPARTKLLLQAAAQGLRWCGGLFMLAAQAAAAAERFTGATVPAHITEKAALQLAESTENVILIGMPGSGKTTVGRELAKRMGRPFVDVDERLSQKLGCSIPDYFASHGEAAFRTAEHEILRQLGKRQGLVVATGGGCVTRPENLFCLKQNGSLIWLQRELQNLPTEGRPISMAEDISRLYAKRRPLYQEFSDTAVSNDGTIPDAAAAAEEAFYALFHH